MTTGNSKAVLVITFDPEVTNHMELLRQIQGHLPEGAEPWLAIKEPAAYVLQAVHEASEGKYPPAVPADDPAVQARERNRDEWAARTRAALAYIDHGDPADLAAARGEDGGSIE